MKPLILGHRGYSAKNPENTGLAFRQAFDAGADGVECDVQKTADGKFVLIHDATLERTSNGRGPVSARTLAELRELDFGQGERVLEVQDLLDLAPPEAHLNFEMKQESLGVADCKRIAQILKQSRQRDRILVSSFEHSLLVPFRKQGLQIGILVGEEHSGWGAGAWLRTAMRIRPDFLNLPHQLFERVSPAKARAVLRALKLAGFRLAFWTVNEPSAWARVQGLADVLITDEVERARNWS